MEKSNLRELLEFKPAPLPPPLPKQEPKPEPKTQPLSQSRNVPLTDEEMVERLSMLGKQQQEDMEKWLTEKGFNINYRRSRSYNGVVLTDKRESVMRVYWISGHISITKIE